MFAENENVGFIGPRNCLTFSLEQKKDQMTNQRYEWQRNWIPRGESFKFDSAGFLLPPTDNQLYEQWFPNNAVKFDSIIETPCLILLGEPGIGKSFALRDAIEQTKKTHPLALVLSINLGEYGDEKRLIEDLFHCEAFLEWKNSKTDLHIFLDSFDECILRLDTVAKLLGSKFTTLETTNKLYFRIASRTAEWRTSLENHLVTKWGENNCHAYQLAPLTQKQVLIATDARAIDSSTFLNQVIHREVVAFAIKPVTLNLLIRIYETQKGHLPSEQSAIYEQGILELCSDSNPERDTPKLKKRLSSEQRMAVASQIAAASMFCGRNTIWKGQSAANKYETDLTIVELATGSLKKDGHHLEITSEAIHETIDSGIFKSNGRDRIGWAHQSYLEYLAARYVTESNLSTKQVLDLIRHPHGRDGKLIPQLSEVASWMSQMNREIFAYILKTEPDILLRSNISSADSESKSKIIEEILKRFVDPEFRPNWWRLRNSYRKLNHPSLQDQLEKALNSTTLPEEAKIEALHIIKETRLWVLLPNLTQIALNETLSTNYREEAADLVAEYGCDVLKEKLRPLALVPCATDPEYELRAAGLKACWPKFLTAKELFSSLVEDNNSISDYGEFLSDHLINNLAIEDLPIALAWAGEQPESHNYPRDPYQGLISRIFEKSVPHLDNPVTLDAFCEAIIKRLRKHDFGTGGNVEYFNHRFSSNPQLRHMLLEGIAAHIIDPSRDTLLFTRWGIKIAIPEDIEWLAERVRQSQRVDLRKTFSHAIRWLFRPNKSSVIDTILTTAEVSPELREAMGAWLEPSILASETAQKAKREFYEEKEFTAKYANQRSVKPISPLPSERIDTLLDHFESGDIDAWWKLLNWMEANDDGTLVQRNYRVDIREFPGWKNASEIRKGRILQAAKQYVLSGKQNIDEWFHKKKVNFFPATAGIRALVLLQNEAPDTYTSFKYSEWTRWTATILRRPAYDETDAYRQLITASLLHAPNEVATWVIKCIENENRNHESLMVLYKLPVPFAPILSPVLLTLATGGKLNAECSYDILSRLIEQGDAEAIRYARSIIPKRPPKRKKERKFIIALAALLLEHGNNDDWRIIRSLITLDNAFGKALFETRWFNKHHQDPPPVLRNLTASDLSHLWEWMLCQYPMEDDPDRSRGGTVTTRWAMANLRDGILSRLAKSGTIEACDELLRLVDAHPNVKGLPYILGHARDEMRRNTWTPPNPEVFFKMTENARSRLVQNSDQLLEVVCEILNDLQEKLHGETPAAPFLWDGNKPKEEEKLSDWIKIELESILRHQGIILGREVQIHLKDRTDIHIDAVTQDAKTKAFDRVKVIIEVKGCWHPEIKTAMKSQLIDRYLTHNDCTRGIYLVGWFVCEFWSKKDSRHKKVQFKGIEEIGEFLRRQASTLSNQKFQVRGVTLDASMPWAKALVKRKNAHPKKVKVASSKIKKGQSQ